MDIKKLDNYFNEVEEPNRVIFNKLTTAEELHYIAENHNWDNGITVLEWIIENNLCSEATALMVFWRAQPYDYIKFSYNVKSLKLYDNVNIDIFNLIRKILKNYTQGFYRKSSIKYNPKEEISEAVPEIMFQGTNGEEPYIYFDEKDSFSMFGDYLDGLLAKCESTMELYNIAYLLSQDVFFHNHEKIFEHKHCDKGIALFAYWKLVIYNFDKQRIINKIINNEYKEIIRYKPDDYRKGKWEIPEIMKKEIK
jgi:hypothetical protein